MLTIPAIKKLLPALLIAILLSATITGQSLWTDEAFSAYIASHHSLGAAWSTMVHGDSSDLQMVFYYLYLHIWSEWFGQSEIAFRSANIPFICVYSGIIVWASQRLFRSNWGWAIPALAPLAVVFASDVRPYFDVIAICLACLTFLLANLKSPTQQERKILPWLILLGLMVGSLFHMLTLLLAPPIMVIIIVYRLGDAESVCWTDWKWPVLTLSPVAIGLFSYFVWTFGRGTDYSYAPPSLLSMASVLFHFVGLSGYGPNRRYDIPFHPYRDAMVLSTTAFACGMGALFLAWSRAASDERLCLKALFYALMVGIVEVVVLSFAVHQQIEFRHLSSLLPLLILIIMAGLSLNRGNLISAVAAVAIGITWLISDIRIVGSPEYRPEDFRSSVRKCLELKREEMQSGRNAAIAVAADPIAPAYYGLSMEGAAPCFPLPDSCQQDLSQVNWASSATAQYALFWSDSQIRTWLKRQSENHSRVILLISRGRHPIVKNSAWWPIIQEQSGAHLYQEFGFFVYLLP